MGTPPSAHPLGTYTHPPWAHPSSRHTPWTPLGDTHPGHTLPGDTHPLSTPPPTHTVNKLALRILLECCSCLREYLCGLQCTKY